MPETVQERLQTPFHDLHAQIDPDPIQELHRRLQMWASVPDADGGALTPSAAIVPDVTIQATIDLVSSLIRERDEARAALTKIREHTQTMTGDDLITIIDMLAEDGLNPEVRAPLRALLSKGEA